MKTKKRTRLTRFLFGFLPLLILASCVKENEYLPETGGDGETMVKFAVQSPGAASPQTRALTEAQENEVLTIDILVFQPGGGTYVYNAVCDASDITTGSDTRLKTFNVKLRQGNFDLVILANARSLYTHSSLTGLSKADALATLEAAMPSGGKWPADGSAPFPMWGDVGTITIDDNTDLTGTNRVKINRMVARVDVNITSTAAANFQLTSVDVYNYNTRGTLVPDMTAWDTTNPDKPYAKAPNVPASSVLTLGPLEYLGAEINSTLNNCVREIYLFEAENHTDATHNTVKGLQERTCLVIGGVWDANGDGDFTNDGAPTYYRVDFSTGTGMAQDFIDVKRNHQYVFNVSKVTGYGYEDSHTAFISGPINIESEVLTWNETDMEDVWFDGVYFYSVSSLNSELWAQAYTDSKITVKTNYPTWTFELSDRPTPGDPAANLSNISWLNIKSHTPGTVNNSIEAGDDILFDLTENKSGGNRTAYLHFTSGRFKVTGTITQTIRGLTGISISPSGVDIPAEGALRTITATGDYEGITIIARDKDTEEIFAAATIPASTTGSSADITIPQYWFTHDPTQMTTRDVLFQYMPSGGTSWIDLETQQQESCWIFIEVEDKDSYFQSEGLFTEEATRGIDMNIKAWGNIPGVLLRTIFDDGTITQGDYIPAGTYSDINPAEGICNLSANLVWVARVSEIQYSTDNGIAWHTILSGIQNRYTFDGGYVLAKDFTNKDGSPGTEIMTWAEAMGVDPVISYESFYLTQYGGPTWRNDEYITTHETGCGAYYEEDVDHPVTGKGKWMLPGWTNQWEYQPWMKGDYREVGLTPNVLYVWCRDELYNSGSGYTSARLARYQRLTDICDSGALRKDNLTNTKPLTRCVLRPL